MARQLAADAADGLVVISAVAVSPFTLVAPRLRCVHHGAASVLCTGNTTSLVNVTLMAPAPVLVRVVVEHLGPESVLAPGELLHWSEPHKRLAYRLPAISNSVVRSRHAMFATDGSLALPEFDVVLHHHSRPVGAHCSRVLLPLCLAGQALLSASTDVSRLWMLPVGAIPHTDGCYSVE